MFKKQIRTAERTNSKTIYIHVNKTTVIIKEYHCYQLQQTLNTEVRFLEDVRSGISALDKLRTLWAKWEYGHGHIVSH
jgi:hypothetical protein